ncbi:hypothetical protein [Rhodoferax sp.]|nr:hypothetical protein [Rhodoferax sp.]MDZ7919212.1 hypothetical protein [Rhodoferax sp.]
MLAQLLRRILLVQTLAGAALGYWLLGLGGWGAMLGATCWCPAVAGPPCC